MEKLEVLGAIKELAQQKQITRKEITEAFDDATRDADDSNRAMGLSGIMYYIGGAIIFLGVSILIGQNWTYLNSFTKIAATLGIALATFLAGVLLRRDTKTSAIAEAMFLVSGLVLPVGLFATIDQLGSNASSPFNMFIISVVLFVVYLASFWAMRKTILEFFAFAFGGGLVVATVNLMVSGITVGNTANLYQYTILGIGAAYAAFGWWYSQEERPLAGVLNGFGVMFFLGSALVLGGYQPNQSIIWEILAPVLTLAVMFSSVRIRSKAYLVFGAIALMVYILKITGEYFSQSFGWPLSLMIAGLLLMAVGYYSVQIKKRFMAKAAKPSAEATGLN